MTIGEGCGHADGRGQVFLAALLAAETVRPVGAAPGDTIRISERPGGLGVNGASFNSAGSDDGRFVAFDSTGTNLLPAG